MREVVTGLSRWAFEADVEHAAERLLPLFRDAAGAGTRVTLVAEGRDDLDLTVAVLTRVLEESSLSGVDAGIALPIAVPEALGALRELGAWARVRVDAGGAPLAVRLDDAVPATDDALPRRAGGLARPRRHPRPPTSTRSPSPPCVRPSAVGPPKGCASPSRPATRYGRRSYGSLADTADVPIDPRPAARCGLERGGCAHRARARGAPG